MINRKTISLLLFIPVLVFSQFKTPFESYDYEKDTEYKQQLTSLKKSEKEGAVEVIESIAALSSEYQDWETAIAYYEKLIEDYPKAEYYFKVGVAAARKSLEVPRYRSVPYIIKARKSVLKAHEMEPENVTFLNLLIPLYAEIPIFFGGSYTYAEQQCKLLKNLKPLVGMIMQAYLYEVREMYSEAKSEFIQVFTISENKISSFDTRGSQLSRDQLFKLGRAAAQYKIYFEVGGRAMDLYIDDYGRRDNYPLEWAHFYRAKIYFNNDQLPKAIKSLQQALEINPNFEECLAFLKSIHDE